MTYIEHFEVDFAKNGDPMPHPMSPLRAVVSRGHIAFCNRNSMRIRALFQSACVKRRSIVRLAARRQGSAHDGLHLDRARSANGFGF